jgi:hypothetical protein
MESGQSLSTCIGMGRDEKVRRWGLQLCFGLFALYKIEHLKNVAREARVSRVKDLEKLLEASMIVDVGGCDVDSSLLYKMKVFKECVAGLCALKRGGTFLHLHIQMVVKLHISSLKMLNKVLKEWLG